MKRTVWVLFCVTLLLPCAYAEEPDIIFVDGKPVYIDGVFNPLERQRYATQAASVSAAQVQTSSEPIPGDIYRGHVLGAPSPERNTEGGDIYRGTVFGQKPAAPVPTANDSAKTKLMYDTSLVRAIKTGDSDRVRTLIYANVDVNERNYAGLSPLTIAAEKDNYEIVRLLVVEGGALVNTTSNFGITPLIAAAAGGHRESVELLLKHGADATAKDDLGRTALIHAMRTDDKKMAESLIKANLQALNLPDNSGNTPLIYAAQKGNTENVKVLLKYKANPDYQNPTNGVSALISAVANGHDKTAQTLVTAGATLDLRDKLGRTALFHAARNGQTNLVRDLIRKGADMNVLDKNGENLLMAAAESQTPQLLQFLTPKYFFIDTTDREGKTPLMYGVQKGVKSLQWLISKGADLNLRDANGDTALMHAIKNGNASAALMLLQQNVDVSAVNRQNKDALRLAREFMPNSPVMVELQEKQAAGNYQTAYQAVVDTGARNYNSLTDKQKALRRQAEQEVMAQDAELAALQRQLNEARARKAKALQAQVDARMAELEKAR